MTTNTQGNLNYSLKDAAGTVCSAPYLAATMGPVKAPAKANFTKPPPPLFSPNAGGKSLLAKTGNRNTMGGEQGLSTPIASALFPPIVAVATPTSSHQHSPHNHPMTLPERPTPSAQTNIDHLSLLSPSNKGVTPRLQLRGVNNAFSASVGGTPLDIKCARSGSDVNDNGRAPSSTAGSLFGGICRSQRGMGTEPSDAATPLSEAFDNCGGGGTGATTDLDAGLWPNVSSGTPCSSYYNAFLPIDISQIHAGDDEPLLAFASQQEKGNIPSPFQSNGVPVGGFSAGASATFSRVTSHHSLFPFDFADRGEDMEPEGAGRGFGNGTVFHQRAFSIASTVGGTENSEILSTDASADDLATTNIGAANFSQNNTTTVPQNTKSRRIINARSKRSRSKSSKLCSADTIDINTEEPAAAHSNESKLAIDSTSPDRPQKESTTSTSSGLTCSRHKVTQADCEALAINNSSPHLLVLPSRAPDYQLMRTFARSYYQPSFLAGAGGPNHPVFAGLQVASIFAAAIQKRFPNGIPMSYHSQLSHFKSGANFAAMAPFLGFHYVGKAPAGTPFHADTTNANKIKGGGQKANSAASPASVMTPTRPSHVSQSQSTPTHHSACSPSNTDHGNMGGSGTSGTFTPNSLSVSPQATLRGYSTSQANNKSLQTGQKVDAVATTPRRLGISKSASSIGGDYDIVSIPSPCGSLSVYKKWRGPAGANGGLGNAVLMRTVASVRELPSSTHREREGAASDATSFDVISISTSMRGPATKKQPPNTPLPQQLQQRLGRQGSSIAVRSKDSTPTTIGESQMGDTQAKPPLPKVVSTDSWATMSSVRHSPTNNSKPKTDPTASGTTFKPLAMPFTLEVGAVGEEEESPTMEGFGECSKTLKPAIVEARAPHGSLKKAAKASGSKPTSVNPYKNQQRAAPAPKFKPIDAQQPGQETVVTVTEQLKTKSSLPDAAVAGRNSHQPLRRSRGDDTRMLTSLVELSIGKAAKFLSVKDYEELSDSDDDDDESSEGQDDDN